jgi:hypothetical protein
MGAGAARSREAGPEQGRVAGDRETLRLAYSEVCKAHQGIADFRAKLLALLPAASGAGIFLVLRDDTPKPAATDMAAIGLFGFAVTFGLFMYELRGIQHCHALRRQAAGLETELEVPADCGQFRDLTRSRMGGLVGVEAASWLVYTAVLMAWLYVAVYGTDWRAELGIALFVLYLVVVGLWLRSKRRRREPRVDLAPSA